MKNHIRLSLVAVLLATVLNTSLSAQQPDKTQANEVVDSQFGFSLIIPDGFQEFQLETPGPDVILCFTDRMPTQEDPATMIQVERMGGVISADSRLKPAEMPDRDGITLQETIWHGIALDIIRHEMVTVNDVESVAYNIQYPLSGEAIQLTVGGPIGRDQEVHAVFLKVAQSFRNFRPLFTSNKKVAQKPRPSSDGKFEKLQSAVIRLSLVFAALIFVVGLVKRAFSKSKND